MNSTTGSDSFMGSQDIGSFSYCAAVSVGILLLITTITLAFYYCTKNQQTTVSPLHGILRQDSPDSQQHIVQLGLDEATLLSYPELLYSEAKLKNKDSTSTCCSICLADYKASDMLRLLPDCGHLFHLKCVDPWLRLHPTCPVCRTYPLPTPLLAEGVSLGSRPLE